MSDFWFYRLRTDIVILVLILRLYFLSYAVELLFAFLLGQFFLFVLVHLITSGIVWTFIGNLCGKCIDKILKVFYYAVTALY